MASIRTHIGTSHFDDMHGFESHRCQVFKMLEIKNIDAQANLLNAFQHGQLDLP
jgi:hypothetical protein